MHVSVIILNMNGKTHLPACLDSLRNQTFQNFEVILIDNGSQDDSCDFLRQQHDWVRLVALPQNVGFARGNNIGLEQASGKYIVTLNNDTRVDERWLEELVAVAESNPRVGMVGSRIMSYHAHDAIDSIGVNMCRDGMSRGAYRLQKFSALTLNRTESIFFPSACAALYKKAMLNEIGFFDDDFFAYCEDTDLGIRGRLAGWDAVVAINAVVYHKYSQSGGTFSPFKLYLVERNHYWMACKNFPRQHLAVLPYYTVLRYLTQVKVVLFAHGSGQEFLSSVSRAACLMAVLNGTLDALLGLPKMWRKRKAAVTYLKKLSSQEFDDLMNTYSLSFKELFDAS